MTPSHCTHVEVINLRGLHARAAARFVKLAETFDAQINVKSAQRSAIGTSLMGLLLLGASKGTTLEVCCEGAQAEEALRALTALITRRFDEDA